MHMPSPKRKSQKRFEQLNQIIDVIAPTLPSPTHLAVLMVCFRHARHGGGFTVSTDRIAKSTKLKIRWVQYTMRDLEKLGVIEMVSEHRGPIPRKYRITGQCANGDTGVTPKPK